MAKQKDIWRFNDEEWKVHIDDDKLCEELVDRFCLHRSTIYYENGRLSEETAWDIIVPNSKINKDEAKLKDVDVPAFLEKKVKSA